MARPSCENVLLTVHWQVTMHGVHFMRASHLNGVTVVVKPFQGNMGMGWG